MTKLKSKYIGNNLEVTLDGSYPVAVRAHIQRNGVRRSRSFLTCKFGGIEYAMQKANEYIHYLRHIATDKQFRKAKRRPGRPLMSEFFGRRIIAN